MNSKRGTLTYSAVLAIIIIGIALSISSTILVYQKTQPSQSMTLAQTPEQQQLNQQQYTSPIQSALITLTVN